jgi:hypothetical protein
LIHLGSGACIAAVAAIEGEKPDAILMVTNSLTALNRKRVFVYAAAHRLPAIYEFDWIVRDGGLMSYAPKSLIRAGSFAAVYECGYGTKAKC